jgi:hypothetical protein
MDLDEIITQAYLATLSLILLAAALGLRKQLLNAGGAITFGGVGFFAALIVVVPVYRIGLLETIDLAINLRHTEPLLGWLFAGSLIVGLLLSVPCLVHAYRLARTGFTQHNMHARVKARIRVLRRDIRNSH